MIWIIKISFILVFCLFLYYLVYNYHFLNKRITKKQYLSQILIVAIMLMIYIRFIIFDLSIRSPSDEKLYVTIAEKLARGENIPVSGPGYAHFIMFISDALGVTYAQGSSIIALLVGSIILLVTFLIYSKESGSERKAAQIIIILISTSYLIWPMVEGRPQQLGMLLVMIGAYLYHIYLKKDRFIYLFTIITILTFFYHILSFLILLGMVLTIWWLNILADRTILKKMVVPSILFILGSVYFFLPGSIYEEMAGGVEWMFETSKVPFLWNVTILPLVLIFSIGALSGLTFIMRRINVFGAIKEFSEKRTRGMVAVILIVTVLALTVQFILNREVYTDKYRGSFLLFILFQIGNVVFGLLFLKGYMNMIGQKKAKDLFFLYSTVLMIMGALVIIVSMFLPLNFNNWLIRIINYWTLFSAPIAWNALISLKTRWRYAVIIALPLLIILSLVNISRDHSIFGYP